MISAAIAILGPVLAKIGAPILKGELEKIGGPVGHVGSVIVDALAGQLGVAPTPEAVAEAAQAEPEKFERVALDVETRMAAGMAARDALLLREDGRETFFAWGWRPAMSWLVIFLFGWAMVILPLVNSAFNSDVPIPASEDILRLAGLWLVIYGGGHTLKSVMGK